MEDKKKKLKKGVSTFRIVGESVICLRTIPRIFPPQYCTTVALAHGENGRATSLPGAVQTAKEYFFLERSTFLLLNILETSTD